MEHIERIFSEIQERSKSVGSEPATSVMDWLGQLTANLAFVNGQMAKTNRTFREAQQAAYTSLQARYKEAGVKMSPSLAKGYVDSQCADAGYAYDMCERCSRTIVHAIDSTRSILSALKEEMNMNRYGGGGFTTHH